MACLNNIPLQIMSYNMHGYNQGEPLLQDVCVTKPIYDIILLQEHWLNPSKLSVLSTYTNYISVSKSSINDKAGILYGRPYGGLSILVRRNLFANFIETLLLRDRVIIIKCGGAIVINLYMPCDDGSVECQDVISEIISDIILTLSNVNYDYIIIGGDFNCDLYSNRNTAVLIKNFLSDFDIKFFRLNTTNGNNFTFSNVNRNCFSVLDFICVTSSLADYVESYSTVDCVNLSDHEPVQMRLNVPVKSPIYNCLFNSNSVNSNSHFQCPDGCSVVDSGKCYRFDKGNT